MFEVIGCSLITILPDYLYRRYGQGKRIGHEITLFSVWYVLRYGITACAILTLTLITIIFYYHPSTTNVSSFYRTISILPESNGRVSEIYVTTGQEVKQGDPIFKIDDSTQVANLEAAISAVAEIDAALVLVVSQLAVAEATIAQAKASRDQTANELQRKQDIFKRNPDVVTDKELDSLTQLLANKVGAYDAAVANRDGVITQKELVLPAQKKSAQSHVVEAQVALDKTLISAGVDATIFQLALQVGDIVNPMFRPAGIMVPESDNEGSFIAGFGQISASVIKEGMIAEITCASKPFTVIPMFVSRVQDVIASGQFRPSDRLIDTQDVVRPGTITVELTPLYEGHTDGIISGSNCVANLYSNHHDLIASGTLGFGMKTYYHVTDALALVHAILLRSQALLLPVRTLVLSGGH
ncbi:HlyD family secretion protein [Falsihalocynthiibacter arcticus]|uniref:Secretion protein HlyD n=1 Tax=Falsihalocynthiibacter arcticus TaxID=1579316 RepID=A0A126V1U2_9RHOB|nr:biotin/lipoyl-binding protein [Falsihalocynthiibacter arcticus]AML52291.1 secretion protein HlyD [Falsihalocynthiibacter arcticus]